MPQLYKLYPYATVPESDRSRVETFVSSADKRTIRAASGGDDSIFGLITQHAFLLTASFIRTNQINPYDPAESARVVAFITSNFDPAAVNGHRPDPRPDRSAVVLTDAGGTSCGQPASASTPLVAANARQSREGRIRLAHDKVKRKVLGEQAGERGRQGDGE